MRKNSPDYISCEKQLTYKKYILSVQDFQAAINAFADVPYAICEKVLDPQ